MCQNEVDNGYFAIIGIRQIDNYRQSENVMVEGIIKLQLEKLRDILEQIEAKYKAEIRNTYKNMQRIQKKLIEKIKIMDVMPGGEVIPLLQEDVELVRIMDGIGYKYNEAVVKSKSLTTDTRKLLCNFCFEWEALQRYILKGARQW